MIKKLLVFFLTIFTMTAYAQNVTMTGTVVDTDNLPLIGVNVVIKEMCIRDRVGSHTGGFTPFSFDITAALSGKGNNKLVVKVWDPCLLYTSRCV